MINCFSGTRMSGASIGHCCWLISRRLEGWNNKSGNSRLNLLSAVLSVRIASTVLAVNRSAWAPKDGSRILIITPYRPQAALINSLLQTEGIEGEVRANTAHSCQGGEAELVILDLVVDEPHHSTTLTTPAADRDVRRLINVAMTRAKRRLIVVGNFTWLKLKGGSSFVGGELLPYLLKKNKPAEATKVFMATVNRGKARTIRASEALPELGRLIDDAKQQIILMSPSTSAGALSTLMPKLLSACLRGINCLLIIRPLQEKGAATPGDRSELEIQISDLRQAGAAVVFKSSMHEKIALVDHRLVWTGTFAPLAPDLSGIAEVRGEITAQRRSRLYEEIVDCLGLEHIYSAVLENQLQCPVCGADIWMADSGRKSNHPFYWKCAMKDCYSRGLTDPSIVAGMIAFKCEGTPALDYRGEIPIWICGCGKRHRCRINGPHLRLPKMWALVPKQRRNRLLRELGITLDDL
jgi:hypothetical protein